MGTAIIIIGPKFVHIHIGRLGRLLIEPALVYGEIGTDALLAMPALFEKLKSAGVDRVVAGDVTTRTILTTPHESQDAESARQRALSILPVG